MQGRVAIVIRLVDIGSSFEQRIAAVQASRLLHDGRMQSGASVAIGGIHIGAIFQENLDSANGLRETGQMKGRLLASIATVDIGMMFQQQTHTLSVIIFRSCTR